MKQPPQVTKGDGSHMNVLMPSLNSHLPLELVVAGRKPTNLGKSSQLALSPGPCSQD